MEISFSLRYELLNKCGRCPVLICFMLWQHSRSLNGWPPQCGLLDHHGLYGLRRTFGPALPGILTFAINNIDEGRVLTWRWDSATLSETWFDPSQICSLWQPGVTRDTGLAIASTEEALLLSPAQACTKINGYLSRLYSQVLITVQWFMV